MEITVDTSVIIAVLLNEESKQEILKLTKAKKLIAPLSLHWEIGNAFSAMLKRNRITLAETKRALAEYQKIPIQFVDVDLQSTLILAEKYSLYAYDAYFLQCAKQYKAPVLTLDKGLQSVAEKLNLSYNQRFS